MTLRGLIQAVERGEFHRKNGPPKYTAMADSLKELGLFAHRLKIFEAMDDSRDEAATILRALEGEL